MFPKHITRCPVCGGNHYEYESLREDMMAIEQNGYCEDCGYFMESDYLFPFEGL